MGKLNLQIEKLKLVKIGKETQVVSKEIGVQTKGIWCESM